MQPPACCDVAADKNIEKRGMQLKNLKSYTSIWKVEHILHGLGDLKLPISLTLSQTCCFVSSELAILFVFHKLPPLCYTDNILLKYGVIPGGLTWFMSKKTFDGKKPYSFLKSVIAYFFRPKRTYAGKTVRYGKQKLDENITIVKVRKEDYERRGGSCSAGISD